MGDPINPRPVLQHQHLRWLLLFVSVVCLFRCGGESPDNRCAEMACPSGTLCVSNAGSCVPVEAKPIALGNAGLWTSAVIQSNGDLLVAAQDQDSGSLGHGPLPPKTQTHINENKYRPRTIIKH